MKKKAHRKHRRTQKNRVAFGACPQPGRAGTKKGLSGNYKLQIPNHKQITNSNDQNYKHL
jgi:hypothetical protein